MKKVVNSVLASALALTVAPMVVGAEEATVTTAEAAATATQTAPAMDPALEKTVKRLEALKLVAGYPGGGYGEDKTITRAEFATLVVRARALEQGAKLAQFQNNYSDVKASDWFAGFVNVASSQDIIKGYTDKTFKPQNQVTYAEAVTMIVRALGYEPSVRGQWPNNFIAKASELGIAKNITEPHKAATRGDIFVMLDNALKVDLMKQIEYGTDIRFQVDPDKNLLTEYLDVAVYDMEWANSGDNDSKDLPFVKNVPVVGLGSLDANEITLESSKAGMGNGSTYKVADGINPNDYAGQHVQVWVKDDVEDTVVWMEGSTDEEVILADIDTIYYDDKIQDDGTKVVNRSDLDNLELKLTDDKTYDVSEDVAVSYNFKRYGVKDSAAVGLKEMFDQWYDWNITVKVVLDENGDIVYIHGIDNDSIGENTKGVKKGSQIIEKVDAEKQTIKNLDGGVTFKDLQGETEGKDFLVFLNGKPAKLADLQPLDVYSVYYADGDKDKPLVFAYRNVVEGKVDSVQKRSGSDYRVKINDKYYRLYAGEHFDDAATSFSDNNNKDVEKITDDETKSLDGEEVKLYLDASGRVRHVETKDNVADRKRYAVVTKDAVYDSKDDDISVSVVDEKGAKHNITLEAKDFTVGDVNSDGDKDEWDDVVDALKANDPDSEAPVVVEIELDKDGKVKEVELADYTVHEELTDGDWDDAADEDDDLIDDGTDEFEVTEDTVVWDLTGAWDEKDGRNYIDDVDTVSFKKVAEKDENITVSYSVDDDEVQFVFVTEGNAVGGDTIYGWVENLYEESGTDKVKVYRNVDGEVKLEEYKLADDVDDYGFIKYDFVAFTLNNDDEIETDGVVKVVNGGSKSLSPEAVQVLKDTDPNWDDANLDSIKVGHVTDTSSTSFDYENASGEHRALTNSKTVVLNGDYKADDVEDGDYVVMIETDDSEDRIDYVLIVSDDEEVDEDELDMRAFLAQDFAAPAVTVSGAANAPAVSFSEGLYFDGHAIANGADVKAYFTYGGGLTDADVTSATYSNGTVTFALGVNAPDGATIAPKAKLEDSVGNDVTDVVYMDGSSWSIKEEE